MGTTASSKHQLPGVARAPAHLLLLLAGADALGLRQVLRMAHAELAALVEVHGVLGDDEAGDALAALARLGPRGDREDLADPGVGDEHLGAVEQVVVALVHRGRGGAAGVAPRAGLGETESAEHLARRQQRHVAPLLLFGAELDDGGGAEVGVGADGERVARVHLGHLVDGDVVGELVHPGAAQLLAPGHAEEAELAHGLDVLPGELRGAVQLAGHGRDPFLGELAHHLADLVVMFGEIERVVHTEIPEEVVPSVGGQYSRSCLRRVELIEFLPAKAAAMKRHEPKGETTKVGSWQYSQAEVREHQDRRLFGIRGVEPEGLERSRRSAGRRLHREGQCARHGRGSGEESGRGYGPVGAREEGDLTSQAIASSLASGGAVITVQTPRISSQRSHPGRLQRRSRISFPSCSTVTTSQ